MLGFACYVGTGYRAGTEPSAAAVAQTDGSEIPVVQCLAFACFFG